MNTDPHTVMEITPPHGTSSEHELAAYFGAPAQNVVLVANATLGLQGALSQAVAEVWRVASWTFVATMHALISAQKAAVFVDVPLEGWSIPVEVDHRGPVGHLITLPFGAKLPKASWGDDVEVVIDAASSFLALENMFGALPLKTALVVSFHATKPLGVGEGAVVVFGDRLRAAQFRAWTSFGFSDSREAMFVSTNAKMQEVTAALLQVELTQLVETRARFGQRRQWVNHLSDRFGLATPEFLRDSSAPYWVVCTETEEELETLETVFSDHRVETRRWWGPGCHEMPAFRQIAGERLVNTERLAATVLGLPFLVDLTPEESDSIQSALEDFQSRRAGYTSR